MAEQNKRAVDVSGLSGGSNGDRLREKFKALSPKSVTFEDTLTEQQVNDVWAKIYSGALGSSPSEEQRAMVRYGVYVYAAMNGTSRVGNYSKPIVLADGTKMDSALIARAAGERRIRQFLRGNMKESYEYLKGSGVLEQNDRFVARVAAIGYSSETAFAVADWLTDSPQFTPQEKLCHEASRVHSLSRAKRSREGRNLEAVESAGLERELEVQGPAHAVGSGSVDF